MTSLPTSRPRRRPLPLLLWRFLTLGWAVVIYQLSKETYGSTFSAWLLAQGLHFLHITVSPATFSTLHFLFRKSAHLTEYAIFGLLLYRSFWNGPDFTWRARTALWAVLAAGLYALTDEYHQSFEPGRTASWMDCGIDTAGAALGMLGFFTRNRLVQMKSTRAGAKNEAKMGGK